MCVCVCVCVCPNRKCAFSGNSSGSKEALSEGLRAPKRGPLRKIRKNALLSNRWGGGEETEDRVRACGNRQSPVLLRLEWGRLGQMQ